MTTVSTVYITDEDDPRVFLHESQAERYCAIAGCMYNDYPVIAHRLGEQMIREAEEDEL
mgnify:CR=1 FL=1